MKLIIARTSPDPVGLYVLGCHLVFADGGRDTIVDPKTNSYITLRSGRTMMKPFNWFETNDVGASYVLSWLRSSLWFKKFYAFFVRYIYQDPLTADLISGCHEKTVEQTWELVAKREAFRGNWFDAWKEQDIDYILTVPNATPAIPHGGMKDCVTSVGYTFLFNIVSLSLSSVELD